MQFFLFLNQTFFAFSDFFIFLDWIVWQFIFVLFYLSFFWKISFFFPNFLIRKLFSTLSSFANIDFVHLFWKKEENVCQFVIFLRRQSGDLKLVVLLFAVCLPQQPKKKIHTHHVLFLVFMTCEVVIFLLISFENINVLEL